MDPGTISPAAELPVYVEYAPVPARPAQGEPAHYHLDFGYTFTTERADIGRIQESEISSACWYPLAVAEQRVGTRMTRAVQPPGDPGELPGPPAGNTVRAGIPNPQEGCTSDDSGA